MTQVTVEPPETVYSVLHCSPGKLDKEGREKLEKMIDKQSEIADTGECAKDSWL